MQDLNRAALYAAAGCVLALLGGLPSGASALPAGWDCIGKCNVAPHGPDGDVTAPPGGGAYNWVSTNGSTVLQPGLNVPPNSETNGSIARSVVFSATKGDKLEFDFNYITSDGSGYIEYAWARVLDPALNPVALLFTARTTPTPGNTIPGPGMPPLGAGVVLSAINIPILSDPGGGGPEFSPLGGYSGACFQGVGQGCGFTDWVHSSYEIQADGSYVLEFGVVNWQDQIYDSAFAFAGTTIAGDPIEDPNPTVPEPGTVALIGLALAIAARRLRSRRA